MTRTLPRPAVAASLLAALTLTLAACGGGGADGLDDVFGRGDDMDCGCDIQPIEPTEPTPTTAP